MSEVNMTPLIDLTFLLLVTFIITFPLIEQGIPVNLPEEKAAEVTPDKSQVVTLDGKGALYLNDMLITEQELTVRMQELGKSGPGVTVLVRADKENRYGSVARILRILYDSKVTKMALMTDGESKR